MTEYVVEGLDEITLEAGPAIAGMDLMSPYVWREETRGGGGFQMLLRCAPRPLGPRDPTGVIAAAKSEDGLRFSVIDPVAIVPDADPHRPDAGGCEDPTVERRGGHFLVFYTGVDAARKQGCMMLATGPDLKRLVKREVVIKAPPGEGNIKEATLACTSTGEWRLFYEYAANNASRIGMATAPSLDGPWIALPDPFTVRADSWDNWHLSTGPIIALPGRDPVMFYNGATHDARWRIGWISFDADFTCVTGRGLEPLLVPPPAEERFATDIAFAASAVLQGGDIALYYSLEDRYLNRAIVRAFG